MLQKEVTGPPVNPLVTPSKAHVMTLPPFTPPTDDRLHSNPITLTTTARPSSTHTSEPHPLTTAAATTSMTSTSNSLSTTQQSLTTSLPWTNELARVKEKPHNSGRPVSEGFTTGWVGGASSTGKIKEKKFAMHEGSSHGADEQIVRKYFTAYTNFIDVKCFVESNGIA